MNVQTGGMPSYYSHSGGRGGEDSVHMRWNVHTVTCSNTGPTHKRVIGS